MNPIDTLIGSKRKYFSFGIKIILIVFSVLVLSQLLGTFLSVLSFEKIFIKTLTSKYEIIGKDIKRRIEQSLRFGKSLDRFVGMDRWVEPLFRKSKELDEVFLAAADGTILFISEKAEFIAVKGVADKHNPYGRILMRRLEQSKSIPVQDFSGWRKGGSATHFYEGRYYVLFPIEPSYGNKGMLGLVFNKLVIDEQKAEIIQSSCKILGLSIIATAIITGVLLKLLFLNPARRQLSAVIEKEMTAGRIKDPLSLHVPDEARQLILEITEFIDKTRTVEKDLKETLLEIESQAVDSKTALYEARLMRDILEGKNE